MAKSLRHKVAELVHGLFLGVAIGLGAGIGFWIAAYPSISRVEQLMKKVDAIFFTGEQP